MRPPASQSALQSPCRLALYKTWERIGLPAIRPVGAVVTLILIGLGSGGCSMPRGDGAFAKMDDKDKEVTGSIGPAPAPVPTDTDLAFARTAASDVLTKGSKDSSQPWENPADRRPRLGDAAGPGLFLRQWPDLPGFPRELR